MSLSYRYRQLAALIESLEADGITVEEAEPIENGGDGSPDDSFRVQLSLELPADATAEESGTDALDAGGNGSVQPVGTYIPASEPVADGENGQSEDAVDGTPRAHTDTLSGGGEGTEATGGEHTTSESRDGDAGQSETTVADAEEGDEDEDGPSDTESTAAADSTTGGTTVDGTGSTPGEVHTLDDDAVACTHPDCDRTFDTERGMKIHRTKAHPLSELVDDGHDRTVHHDPSVLARVYDEHDTFAEMTDALDVDVGAQAVRKQMIRHGIHEPGAASPDDDEAPSAGAGEVVDEADAGEVVDEADAGEVADEADEVDFADEADAGEAVDGGDAGKQEASDGSDEPDGRAGTSTAANAEAVEPDESATGTDTTSDESMVSERLPDLDLPGSLSTADLQTAVEEATTMYDVQRSLDLDRETTRNVLSEYDLLELVSGRAAALRDREELKTEINQRIRRRAT